MAHKKTTSPPQNKDIPAVKSPALDGFRQEIDAIDDTVIDLLNRRARVAQKIGTAKAKTGARAYVPERERKVLERLIGNSEGPLPDSALRAIYKEVISASLALESPLQVSFLGPQATFTHEAAKRHFGMGAQLTARPAIPDIFSDVERGRTQFGVVPIENSTEGVVNHTLDSFMLSELKICAEVLMQVSHNLLSSSGSYEGITKIYSHPQALAQCRNWLNTHLPGVPQIDVSSTARAAQLVSEDSTAAAISSDFAASMYGLKIAASHLEDMSGNVTRFLIIGHDTPPPSKNDRTSLMFALKDAPGILFEALKPFASRGINMSRIESRPSRRRAWDYLFFIDLVGHTNSEDISNALNELQQACQFIKVLGSYPQAPRI